jgi:hypothetical protein
MILNEELLLEEINKSYTGTLEEHRESVQHWINILGDLSQSLADARIKTDEWKYYSDTLIHKLIFTSNSIISLSRGNDLQSFRPQGFKLRVIDYPSLFVLTRSLIENYLTLCYIYNNNLSTEERLFRFKLWQISGLMTRQNFQDPDNLFDAEKKASESKIIEQIFSEIEKMEEFKSLDKRKLQNLKKHGVPRIKSWHDLINESNLKQPIFSKKYSFFSEYAHSEFLSILQISQASLNEEVQSRSENVPMVISTVRMIVSLCIRYYIRNYKCAELIFNTLPVSHATAILLWCKIAENSEAK